MLGCPVGVLRRLLSGVSGVIRDRRARFSQIGVVFHNPHRYGELWCGAILPGKRANPSDQRRETKREIRVGRRLIGPGDHQFSSRHVPDPGRHRAPEKSFTRLGRPRGGGTIYRGQMAIARTQEGSVRPCGGFALSKRTLRSHGARSRQEHAAGTAGPQTRVRARLSLPPSRQETAGPSGSRIRPQAEGYLRAWLFLASARALRAGAIAKVASRLLAAEA